MKVPKSLLLQVALFLMASTNANAAENKSELYSAAESGDLAKVKLCVGKGASPNAKDAQAGMTAMHVAAEKGHTEILKYLLDHNGEINSQQHPYLETPLIEASQFGRLDSVKLLLSRGAKANVKGKYGYNALAALANNVGVASNNSSREQVEEIMRLLTRGGADPNVQNNDGWDILHMPAYSNDVQTVQFILANSKINPNLKTKEGETVLDYCCRGKGGVEMFDLLTKAGFTSGKGLPFCLDGAVQESKPDLVKKLLTLTKPNPGLLAVAAQGQNANSEQVALAVLDKTADVNARRSASELTALQAAAATNKVKLTASLLRRGARLSDTGNFFTEGNALHMAARFGHPEIVQLLLQSGADANAKNNYGDTPLLLAVQGPIDYRPSDGPAPDYSKTPDYAKVVALLISKGADARATNSSGKNVDTLLNAVRNEDFKTQIRRALSSR